MIGLFRLSPRVVRWGGVASMLAGLLSFTYHVLARAYPFQFGRADTDYLLEGLQGMGAAAGIVLFLAIRYLHTHAGRGYGRLGGIGFVVSMLGNAARMPACTKLRLSTFENMFILKDRGTTEQPGVRNGGYTQSWHLPYGEAS